MQNNQINILWTGGWDSTYRILELINTNVNVQPYYIIDYDRKSVNHELTSINVITKLINSIESKKLTLKNLVLVDKNKIQKNEIISKSYLSLKSLQYIGSQYDWLARFAAEFDYLELSIHKDDKAVQLLKSFAELEKINYHDSSVYAINTKKSTDDVNNIFGKFVFPLFDKTKLDMLKYIEENGYENIMSNTWFCHTPINGKTCGLCKPCRYTIEEGLVSRLSKTALIRYRFRGGYKLFFGILLLFKKLIRAFSHVFLRK